MASGMLFFAGGSNQSLLNRPSPYTDAYSKSLPCPAIPRQGPRAPLRLPLLFRQVRRVSSGLVPPRISADRRESSNALPVNGRRGGTLRNDGTAADPRSFNRSATDDRVRDPNSASADIESTDGNRESPRPPRDRGNEAPNGRRRNSARFGADGARAIRCRAVFEPCRGAERWLLVRSADD